MVYFSGLLPERKTAAGLWLCRWCLTTVSTVLSPWWGLSSSQARSRKGNFIYETGLLSWFFYEAPVMVDFEHLKIVNTYREGSSDRLVSSRYIILSWKDSPNVHVISTCLKVHVLLKLLNENVENWKAGSKLNVLRWILLCPERNSFSLMIKIYIEKIPNDMELIMSNSVWRACSLVAEKIPG